MAREAIQKMSGIKTVVTDMNAHTVAVTLEDSETSVDAVIKELAIAGYSVPSFDETQ